LNKVLSVAFLAAAALSGCSKKVEVSPEPIQWPPLSNYPGVSGRAATTADVDAKKAVFVLQADGQPIGRPLAIKVPQYAFHIEEGTKHRTPCVIIQAEEARGQQLIGCRKLPEGELLVAMVSEFELLGETPPAPKR
jgi:hypothetical protein